VNRKTLVTDLLRTDRVGDAQDSANPTRVPSGAVRAMGLELGRLTEAADQANALRHQIANGSVVVDLDPNLIEPSFIADRLAPTDDADYRRLVESVRALGQKVPILVRPHPEAEDRYQIAYGHRRWQAALGLGIAVRAIVQSLTDVELVIAQGKENAERRNLSFIERALFAAHLQARGFDRATINAALAVQAAETSRLLGVAEAVPAPVIRAVGPAPKAGRPRWRELAELLGKAGAEEVTTRTLEASAFKRGGTNARFEYLLAALRDLTPSRSTRQAIADERGKPVVWFERTARSLHFWVDGEIVPTLGDYLLRCLPDLVKRFEHETDGRSPAVR
jgi:ParB family chromosome partitioning protein